MTDLEQTIERSIDEICKRIPDLAIRDVDRATSAVKNLCLARAALTAQRSTEPDLAKECANRVARENFRNLYDLCGM